MSQEATTLVLLTITLLSLGQCHTTVDIHFFLMDELIGVIKRGLIMCQTLNIS